ncbi:MAG: hypothetical protein KQH83_08550 [Actinobacteria bacterium]|nr:hypothetical protein [Actinomycetota bacterium]
MKKFAALTLALGLLVAACGGDDAASDPASIDTCEGIADATIATMQEVIDLIGDMDAADLAALGEPGAEMPESFAGAMATGEELAARGTELECANLGDLLMERADQLEVAPDNVIGAFVKQGLMDGSEDVFGRLGG